MQLKPGWGKKVWILGTVGCAAFLIWAWTIIVLGIRESNSPGFDPHFFYLGTYMELLCEWHFPATNGVPESSVTCCWSEKNAFVQCCQIEGGTVRRYFFSENKELHDACRAVFERVGNQEGGADVAGAGVVSVRWWPGQWNDPRGMAYPLNGAPPEIERVWRSVRAAMVDTSAGEWQGSYLRFRSVSTSAPVDSAQVIDVAGFCGSAWNFGLKKRDVLRFLWWSDILIPIDKGVDPFKCINQDYHPGRSLTLNYRFQGKDCFRQVDVFAGKAFSENADGREGR
jgi:hypothetical protein